MKITRTMSFRMDWINSNHAVMTELDEGGAEVRSVVVIGGHLKNELGFCLAQLVNGSP